MKSNKIPLDKLNNTRDLGGLITKTGKRIKNNMLFRSGLLYGASEEDLKILSNKIGLVIDFRSGKERRERPDPIIDSCKNIHLPAIRDFTEGITREKQATISLVQNFASDPEGARNYMINIYKSFVTDELPLATYSKFLNLLLENGKKGILWHCTAGKDRAGFASVIVEELLEIDRDSIFEDYLYTNECIKDEVPQIASTLEKKYLKEDKSIEEVSIFYKTIDYLFGAKEEYLSGVYDKIDEKYGSFENFIDRVLNIKSDKREEFKKLFLL